MLLARTVEHTADVDGMLERIGEPAFQEWMAKYRLDPWERSQEKPPRRPAAEKQEFFSTFAGKWSGGRKNRGRRSKT
jgi:hypothetical protein